MADNLSLNTAFEKCGILYQVDEPLKKHVSFKIGGNADYFVTPKNIKQLIDCLQICKESNTEFYVLGNGSNVVFTDKGYRGVVISTLGLTEEIELISDDRIKCFAGVKLSSLCSFALENSLSGLECLWGIPGTVGGAVYMNAGAYGGQTSDTIIECTGIDSDGNMHSYNLSEMDLSYRHSRFTDSNEIILWAVFKLKSDSKSNISEKMNDLMCRRKSKQPLEYPSAGSVFKRPEGYFAAALIEECGLKGTAVGDCEVSHKHSGFIINTGDATCNDLLTLIDKVKAEVFKSRGVKLECEIKIVGQR